MSNDRGDDWLLLIICSPSGAGKTTLKNRLLAERSDLRFSVSHTTRTKRPHEIDGRDYHFVDKDTFAKKVADGAFAEWAEVHANCYGTSHAEIELARATHRGVVFDIDYQGARQLKASLPDAVTVFVLPPSMAELERRLRTRGDEREESVVRRLANARDEIEHYAIFDYLIINDELDRAYGELAAIVGAERSRRARRAALAERMLRKGTIT